MSDALAADWRTRPAPKNDAERKMAVRQMLSYMDEVNAQTAQDQAEIDRLKVETRAMLATISGSH